MQQAWFVMEAKCTRPSDPSEPARFNEARAMKPHEIAKRKGGVRFNEVTDTSVYYRVEMGVDYSKIEMP